MKMRSQFFCKNCKKIFEAEGIKKEYTDPVFGPCSSFHAFCPDCNAECSEYIKPKRIKISSSSNIPSSGCSGPCCSCQS